MSGDVLKLGTQVVGPAVIGRDAGRGVGGEGVGNEAGRGAAASGAQAKRLAVALEAGGGCSTRRPVSLTRKGPPACISSWDGVISMRGLRPEAPAGLAGLRKLWGPTLSGSPNRPGGSPERLARGLYGLRP